MDELIFTFPAREAVQSLVLRVNVGELQHLVFILCPDQTVIWR